MSSVSRAFACEPAALESPPADWRHEKSAAADIRVRTGVESASVYFCISRCICICTRQRVQRRILGSAECWKVQIVRKSAIIAWFNFRTEPESTTRPTVRQRFGLTWIETNWGWLWFCKTYHVSLTTCFFYCSPRYFSTSDIFHQNVCNDRSSLQCIGTSALSSSFRNIPGKKKLFLYLPSSVEPERWSHFSPNFVFSVASFQVVK